LPECLIQRIDTSKGGIITIGGGKGKKKVSPTINAKT